MPLFYGLKPLPVGKRAADWQKPDKNRADFDLFSQLKGDAAAAISIAPPRD